MANPMMAFLAFFLPCQRRSVVYRYGFPMQLALGLLLNAVKAGAWATPTQLLGDIVMLV